MADPQEITALKASFRGAMTAAEQLAALKTRVESLGPTEDPQTGELEEWGRLTAAHAIASAALRGLIVTMRERRDTA